MELNKIFNGSISAGDSKTFQLQKEILNSLIGFTTTTAAQGKLLIDLVLRDDHDTRTLASRIPVSIFAELTNQMGGYSPALNNILQHIDNEDASAAASNLITDFHPFEVLLGCIDTEDSVLEVRVQNTDSGPLTFGLYHSCDDVRPDEIIQYNISESKNEVYPDSESIYLISAAGVAPNADINVVLKDGNKTLTSDLYGYYAYTLINGQLEVTENLHAVQIYENTDEVPDDVTVNLQGSDIGNVQVLHITKIQTVRRVSRSTFRNTTRHMHKIEKLERSRPQKCKALRYAGKVVKSKYISKIVRAMRTH